MRKPNLEEWRKRGYETIGVLADERGISYPEMLRITAHLPRKGAWRPSEVSPGSSQKVIVGERAAALAVPRLYRSRRPVDKLGITGRTTFNKSDGSSGLLKIPRVIHSLKTGGVD